MKYLWLLTERETATCIKVTRKDGKSEKNSSNSGGNGDKSEKNAIKEKKEKEKKGKENIDAAGFAMFRSACPKKSAGRGQRFMVSTIAKTNTKQMQRCKNLRAVCGARNGFILTIYE